LSEILAALEHGNEAESTRRDSIFKTIACKAAIKAGKASDRRELEALAVRVLSGEITQCPHGRPVAFEMTRTSLDKGFKRI
jgi:DNA mismatch repair protein MutL